MGGEVTGELKTAAMLRRMIDSVEQIPAASCFRNPYKKHFCRISRKLKLLAPMLDEMDLVHLQFKRAEDPVDDDFIFDLYNDLRSICNNINGDADPIIIHRVLEQLQFFSISDVIQESAALYKLVMSNEGAVPEENLERMFMLLKKIKDFLLTHDYNNTENSTNPSISASNITIPDDFHCPISLELMNDPVIVSTGQTYERRCIQKWLEDGHDTCPKTQQRLINKCLIPNIIVRGLILHWSEKNRFCPSMPFRESSSRCFAEEHENVTKLVVKLSSHKLEDQRSAASELRLLSKRCSVNRRCIADSGAVPVLVTKLSKAADKITQTHAVTILLNLSIFEEKKKIIVSSGAVPKIVNVLKNGDMEARENAAATLFRLSSVDENRILISCESDAIPALVLLLQEGREKGKKNAATALFGLCKCQRNKSKAVKAGLVQILAELLVEPRGGLMVDIALTVLANISGHPDGQTAIRASVSMSVLVKHIGSRSSQKAGESAVTILLRLCSGKHQHICLAEAHECEALPALRRLLVNGTARAKRRATALIDCMNRFVDQQMNALSFPNLGRICTEIIFFIRDRPWMNFLSAGI